MKKKKPNIKTIIRQIVREEVAMSIQEVITELKQPTHQVSQPKPKKIVEKKSYTNNSVLNDVLNETAVSDEWKTMGGGELTTNRMNDVIGKNYGNMMSNNTPDVNPNDPMSQFLNKDYSEVLEKSYKKSGKK